jgi:peptide deformylase
MRNLLTHIVEESMALLKVLVYPNQGLRVKAKPVSTLTPALKQQIEDMCETLYAEDGVGLAATQVDIHFRIMVVDVSQDRNGLQVLINPMITHKEGKVPSDEGCLSFPGIRIEIERAEKVTLEATDMEGNPIHIQAEGLLARCLQHEMDHLDGIVFTDHLSRLKRERAHKKVLKYRNDPEEAA